MKTLDFKKQIFIIALLLQANFLLAQRYEWQSFGESLTASGGASWGGEAIVRDGAGNLYTTAFMTDNVMIQGDTIHPLTVGLHDFYIAKFNAQGQRIWTKRIGAPANNDDPWDMAIDDSANLYVFEYSGATNIDFGDTILNMVGSILFKLDSAGHFKWATQIPYTPSCGKYIEYSRGFVFVGSCSGLHKVSSQDGSIITTLAPTTGSMTGPRGSTVAPDGDLIFAYSNSAPFTMSGNSVSGIATADGTGGNLLLIRFDTAMQLISLKAYASIGVSPSGAPVAADNNNVYVAAWANNTIYFGTDSVLAAPYAGMLLKMDAMMNPVSAKRIYTSDFHELNALMIANNGIYLGGNYGAVTNLNNGDSLPAASNGDNLLVKMDFNGNVIWASGTGTAGGTDRVNDLTNDGVGNCYFAGQDFSGNAVFSCKTTSSNPGMCIVSFNDGSDIAPTPVVSQSGNVLTITPPFADNIQWYENDTAIAGANGQTYTITEDGNYSVTFTNHYGCSSTSDTSFFQWIDGVSELQNSDFNCQIYPNPANDLFTIKSDKPFNQVEVFNLLGVSVIFKNKKENQLNFSVENLSVGNYFIKITDEKNNSVFKQITIAR